MLIPVVCFTCGGSLGHVATIFRIMRARLVKEHHTKRKVLPQLAGADPGLQIDCSELLQELAIVNDCCRGCLATSACMADYL